LRILKPLILDFRDREMHKFSHRKKGWNKFDKLIECAASTDSIAQSACDARAKVGFRCAARDVHAAVDQRIDQRPDDFGAIQHAAGCASARGQALEVGDLSIEQDDRDLRPRFTMDARPSRAPSRGDAR
jgi:hypothetical protein